MGPTDSLGLEWHCFGTVAEVPGIVVAAEVPDIAVAAEENQTADSGLDIEAAGLDIEAVGLDIEAVGLDIEAVGLHTVGLAAVGYMSLVPGKLDSLDERLLQQTIWHADCRLCQGNDFKRGF